MIIDNGTIEFKEKSAGGIDPKTGYPQKSSSTWGKPIPCQFLPINRNLLAKSLGEPITQATYTVLIEDQPLPDAEQLRLKGQAGKTIGEFSLIAPPEALEAVGEIKILI